MTPHEVEEWIVAGRRYIVAGAAGVSRPPRGRPDQSEVARLSAAIERRHRRDLEALRRPLFRPEPVSRDNPPPRLVANSLTDRHGRISVVASIEDPTDPSWPSGHALVQVSVAGHHRTLGRRLHVAPEEEEAWVRAVLGPAWAPHAYDAGSLTQVNSSPGAELFMMVLDPQHRPTAWPAGATWTGQLRPLNPESAQSTA